MYYQLNHQLPAVKDRALGLLSQKLENLNAYAEKPNANQQYVEREKNFLREMILCINELEAVSTQVGEYAKDQFQKGMQKANQNNSFSVQSKKSNFFSRVTSSNPAREQLRKQSILRSNQLDNI